MNDRVGTGNIIVEYITMFNLIVIDTYQVFIELPLKNSLINNLKILQGAICDCEMKKAPQRTKIYHYDQIMKIDRSMLCSGR